MYRKILFPVDLSNQDVQVKALSVAIQWCQAFAAELHVLTVIPDYGLSYVAQYFPNGYIEKMSAEVSEKLAEFIAEQVPEEVAATALVRHGTPYNEILTTAEEWTLLTKVETSCDRILIAGGANVEAEWEQGPAV